MKFYTFAVILMLSSILFAENEIPDPKLVYKNVTFRATENPYIEIHYRYKKITGHLMGMRSDSVLINVSGTLEFIHTIQIHVDDIYFLKRDVDSNVLSSSLTGFALGAGLGGLFGYIGGRDNSEPDKIDYMLGIDSAEKEALFIGGCFSIIGAITGLALSHGHNTIDYDLSEETYYQKVELFMKLGGI